MDEDELLPCLPDYLESFEIPGIDQPGTEVTEKKKPGMPMVFNRWLKIRISKELLDQWNAYIDRNGFNGSELIRDMIKRRLNTEEFMKEYEKTRSTRDM